MDGAKIQSLINKGLGKASKKLGSTFSVYRSASLLNPLDPANARPDIQASITTGYQYSRFNKPNAPEWTLVADATDLLPGDWLVGDQTFYLATIQPLLPMPVIQCNRVVSITRPGYSSAGGNLEASEITVASSLPVFMFSKGAKAASAHAIAFPTNTTAAMDEWVVYINARALNGIQKHDILVDENGDKYEFSVVNFTDWGCIATVRTEKP